MLGRGNDTFFVHSTPLGTDARRCAPATRTPVPERGQRRGQRSQSIGGTTTIELGGGNDVMRVNYRLPGDGIQTFANGIGGLLTLRGEAGGDLYEIGLSGAESPIGPLTRIEVDDSGAGDDRGVNRLRDLRHRRRRLLPAAREPARADRRRSSAFEVDANRQPVAGGFFERDQLRRRDQRRRRDLRPQGQRHVRARRQPRADDDLRRRRRRHVPDRPGLPVAARRHRTRTTASTRTTTSQTTLTTRGYLSATASRKSTSLFGGTGNDSFTVYRNLAELFLFGEEDDDTFTRARVRPRQPGRPEGAVHEHQRRPGRGLHLLHGQLAGARSRAATASTR